GCMKAGSWPSEQGGHASASIGKETAAQTVRRRRLQAVLGRPVQKGFSAMKFRMLAAPMWSRGRIFALLAIAGLGTALAAPEAGAQTPAPSPAPAPAAPKAKPAAPKAAQKGTAPAPSPQQAPPPAAAAPQAAPPAD